MAEGSELAGVSASLHQRAHMYAVIFICAVCKAMTRIYRAVSRGGGSEQAAEADGASLKLIAAYGAAW